MYSAHSTPLQSTSSTVPISLLPCREVCFPYPWLWCLSVSLCCWSESSFSSRSFHVCHCMSSSISFIVSFSHFSLSSLTALLTLLQQLVYSLRLSTSVHSSCHFSKARCFSISFNVSSVIYFLLYCLFLCRCSVADFITAFFISFQHFNIPSCTQAAFWWSHGTPLFSVPVSGAPHLDTSLVRNLPFSNFSLREITTKQWSLFMSAPLCTLVSSTDDFSLCFTRA